MADRHLILVLGGARSGKSTYAENWAYDANRKTLYVATAQALDDEMRERIAAHQASRPAAWTTLEAPLNTGERITELLEAQPYNVILVDCVTLLATNALLTLPEDCTAAQANQAIEDEISGLLAAYQRSHATWLVISNEVGMGIVPPYKLGRLYRDALGRANQRIARSADEVLLLVAGLPWKLK